MEKISPYIFFVVLSNRIIEIPQDCNLSWLTLFYALPVELVEKRPEYLKLPRNIHQLLNSEECRKQIETDAFLELIWDCLQGVERIEHYRYLIERLEGKIALYKNRIGA